MTVIMSVQLFDTGCRRLRWIDIPGCLDHVARLEVMSLTSEDLAKTTMYIQDRKRRELKGSFSQASDDLDDYLRSLDMCIEIGLDDRRYIKRFAQLTQKTNQFNLTTRRYDEKQIESFIDSEDWLVFHFSLIDIFGDSGIVGLALFNLIAPRQMKLDTFLMSCRVIGRKAESAFFQAILSFLKEENIHSVIAEYFPTRKNTLVENLLSEEGFDSVDDNQYLWNFSKVCPKSEAAFPISVKGLEEIEKI
jgi:FkbH-like protein